jgi:hypothetical protein
MSSIFTVLHVGILLVSCQESGSLWIPTIYSFTCNSNIYAHYQYTQDLCQSTLCAADHALTHVAHVTAAA